MQNLQIVKIIKRAIASFLCMPKDYPVAFRIIAIVNIVMCLIILFLWIRQARNGLWRNLNAFGKLLYVLSALLRCTVLPIISIFFVMIDFYGDIQTMDLFNKRFFIEITITAVVSAVLQLIVYGLSEELNGSNSLSYEDQEEATQMGGMIFKYLGFIILSVIFIFTKLSSSLPNFGFRIFHKTLGGHLMAAYAAWTGSVVINLLIAAFSLLFLLTRFSARKNRKR